MLEIEVRQSKNLQKMNNEIKDHDMHVSQHSSNEMLAAALSGNKLIAEFMGVKIGVDNYSWRIGCIEPIQEKHLNYHASWGWLMPVIEKISRIEFHREMQDLGDGKIEVIIYTHYPRTFGMLNNETCKPMFRYNSGCVFEAETLIEAAWFATVDMIKTLCPKGSS